MNKSSRIVLMLFIVLVPPFLLKTMDTKLELFPAIILPSYAGKVDYASDPSLIEFEIYGLKKDGSQKRIDRQQFFKDVPIDYANWIIKRNFGLKESQITRNRLRWIGLSYTTISKTSPEEVLATKTWIGERLKEQDCLDSVLLVRKNRITISKETRTMKNKRFLDETVFLLYE